MIQHLECERTDCTALSISKLEAPRVHISNLGFSVQEDNEIIIPIKSSAWCILKQLIR